MITDSSIEIDAPAAVVWDVFTDVERWPEWTASVERIVRPRRARHRGRASASRSSSRACPSSSGRSPRSSPASRGPGASSRPAAPTLATHEVVRERRGRTLVRQRIDQRGPVGVAVGVLMRRLTKRYLDLEAQGLKARSEQLHRRMPRPPDDQRRTELLDALIDAFAERRHRRTVAARGRRRGRHEPPHAAPPLRLTRRAAARDRGGGRAPADRACSPSLPRRPGRRRSPPCGPTCAGRSCGPSSGCSSSATPAAAQGEAPFARTAPGGGRRLARRGRRAQRTARPTRHWCGSGLAVTRGLLLDLVATGDEEGVDAAAALYASMLRK